MYCKVPMDYMCLLSVTHKIYTVLQKISVHSKDQNDFSKKKNDDISCTSSNYSVGPYKCSYYMYLKLTGLAQSQVPCARPLLTKNN